MMERDEPVVAVVHPQSEGRVNEWIEYGLCQRDHVAIEAMKALIPLYENGYGRVSVEAESALTALGGQSLESIVATRAFGYADALIKASKGQ